MTATNYEYMRMIKMIMALSLLLIVLLFIQCEKKSKGAFTVTVAYKNADKMVPREFTDPGRKGDSGRASKTPRILLEAIPYGGDMNPIILDSGTLATKDGKLVLKGNAKEESIFQLEVENGPLLLLINDEENINVDIDLSKRENYYSVSGSDASTSLKDFIRQYSEKTFEVNKAFTELDSLKQLAASDSLVIKSTGKKNKAVAGLNDYLQDFIRRSDHPALSLFALGWSSRSFPQPDFEKVLDDVVKKFPDHQTLQTVRSTYEMQKAQITQQEKKQETNSWVGKPVPDLSLPDTEGKNISIASFRGKYLLVDFWASWCGPCRQENPNVVKAFNAFKDKNFTILGVSLDKEKGPWLKAIKDDQLAWTHISDLRYWNSKAVEIFNFEGIPFNVLIDPQGKIIAENLRGFDLEQKLQEVLQ